MFGGVRTPLSGRNSKHQTSGDVIRGDPGRDPPWLCLFPEDRFYIEVKRNRLYEVLLKAWGETRESLKMDWRFCLALGDTTLFHVEEWLSAESDPLPDAYSPLAYRKRRSALGGLFEEVEGAAAREGGKVPVVALRWHNRRGIFLLVRQKDVGRVLDYLRGVRECKDKEEACGKEV